MYVQNILRFCACRASNEIIYLFIVFHFNLITTFLLYFHFYHLQKVKPILHPIGAASGFNELVHIGFELLDVACPWKN